MEWPLSPGAQVARRALHELLGGRVQGAISPSRAKPVVLLFTLSNLAFEDAATGWGDDGCFHYVGEGQSGDQRMAQGNLAVANHKADGRTLHLFVKVAGTTDEYQYVGEFELAEPDPWYWVDAPADDAGVLTRSVVVFRLKPVGRVEGELAEIPFTPTKHARLVEREIRAVSDFELPAVRIRPKVPSEADLVREFAKHQMAMGHSVTRTSVVPPGESRPSYVDLVDKTANMIVEAKTTTSRQAVRLAIGSLLDHRRHLEPTPELALLVPARLRPDLLDFCASVGVTVFWPEGDGFESTRSA